jgi:hypothetical protein
MDRIISLLAALVGLIALGGAIAVHTNADSQRREMATEIAALKTSIALLGTPAPAGTKAVEIPQLMPVTTSAQASIPSAEPASSEAPSSSSSEAQDTGKAMKDLQDRISSLEATTKQQASELDAARSQLASVSSAPAPKQVATAETATVTPMASGASDAASSQQPAATPAAVIANGPTKDCIPLGTRFMGQGGDSFPICKTRLVLKVAAVSDGLATINGAGDVAAGATVPYDKGCTLAVFSADTSGFAEMRVTCQ